MGPSKSKLAGDCPSKPLGDWIKGIANALETENCKRRELYSWMARVNDEFKTPVFFVERDHVDKESNYFDRELGIYEKSVPALSLELGDSKASVRHAEELYQAVYDALDDNEFCRVLIMEGTRNGTERSKGVWCVFDPDWWSVVGLSGSVREGFSFRLERQRNILAE